MIEQLRADTPACTNFIHLNNAGASLQPTPVFKAVQDYLILESQMGGYEVADAKADDIKGFYSAYARLLHAKPANIAFAGSATDAYARALSAIPFKPGDCILTTENDYASNQISFLSLQKRMGIQFIRARDAAAGGADVEDVERLIKQHRPVLVSVSHVPSSSGLIQPVEDIGRFCRAEGIWYLVDACQSAGQLVLDVNKIGCDFLSAATRKFMRGPRGGGFLFASDRALEAGLEPLLPDMHGAKWTGPDSYQSVPDARRFEYWEMSGAILLGSKAAAEYALSVGMDWIQATVTSLAAYTRNRLAEIPDVQVLDHGEKLSGIVTCYCKNWDSKTLLPHLSARNIHCRVSSHGVAQIDFSRKKVPWALRISPHYYNTEAEIDATIDVLKSMPNAAHT